MVYEGTDGSARWEGYWMSPRNPDGAARWKYASHWPIDLYSPNLAEGEFSEVQIRYSAYPYDDGEQIPLFGTIRTSARPQHVVVVDKCPVISSEQMKVLRRKLKREDRMQSSTHIHE